MFTKHWRHIGVLLLTLLIGFWLRTHALEAYPSGVHFDEAANGLLAGNIAYRGSRPVFIPSYTGKEALFFYLVAGVMRGVGEGVFGLRLTSAFVGLLTIAVTYRLCLLLPKNKGGKTQLSSKWVGLLAAIFLATSFEHILFSRLGFRAITQPLFQGLTVLAFGLGIKRLGQPQGITPTKHFALAGIFLGLTGYTYLAARLFPVLFGLGILFGLFLLKERRAAFLRFALLTLGVALVTLAPLLVYFTQNPDAFWVRIDQVSGSGFDWVTVGFDYVRSLGMFFFKGDPYMRFNVPNRPIFNPITFILLVIGWLSLVSFKGRKRPFFQAILLYAPFIMILPTALATGEILPSNLRAIGIFPFIILLPAIGLGQLDVWPRWHKFKRPIALIILLLGATSVYQSYFVEWGNRADLFLENDGDLTDVAAYVDQLDPELPIFVTSKHFQHPTLALLSERYDDVKWLPNSEAIVKPASGEGQVVFSANSNGGDWEIGRLGDLVSVGESFANKPNFVAYDVGELAFDVEHELMANFGNQLELMGYEVESAVSGDTITFLLRWRVLAETDRNWQLFAHVVDDQGYRWGQTETLAYPALHWQAGDEVLQRITVPVEEGMPPTLNEVVIGVFEQESGERLTLVDDNGRFAGTVANFPIIVKPTGINAYYSCDETDLVCLFYDSGIQSGVIGQGELLNFNLGWFAFESNPEVNATLYFLRAGKEIYWDDYIPVRNTYPFTNWDNEIYIIDRFTKPIPIDLPLGMYSVQIEFNNQQIELGNIRVTESTRTFDLPQLTNPSDAEFGERIALKGWQINNGQLTIAWQALADIPNDYTIFAQLLNADGTCCAWQQDTQPLANSYPTSRWLKGEVVVDTFDIGQDVGELTLLVGWYNAENGQRLPVLSDAYDRDDNAFWLTEIK